MLLIEFLDTIPGALELAFSEKGELPTEPAEIKSAVIRFAGDRAWPTGGEVVVSPVDRVEAAGEPFLRGVEILVRIGGSARTLRSDLFLAEKDEAWHVYWQFTSGRPGLVHSEDNLADALATMIVDIHSESGAWPTTIEALKKHELYEPWARIPESAAIAFAINPDSKVSLIISTPTSTLEYDPSTFEDSKPPIVRRR